MAEMSIFLVGVIAGAATASTILAEWFVPYRLFAIAIAVTAWAAIACFVMGW